MNGFKVGQMVRVVEVRPCLGAEVGDTAVVVEPLTDYEKDCLRVRWEPPVRGAALIVYADQFEPMGGPW